MEDNQTGENQTAPELKTNDEPGHVDVPASQTPAGGGKLKNWWAKYLAKKKVTFPLTVVVLIGLILAIPQTRYQALGLFIKRQFSIEIIDDKTKQPISNADISFKGQTATTDKDGKANVKVKVGSGLLKVTKKYYGDFSHTVLVPVSQKNGPFLITLQATGRLVPITVLNKVDGKTVQNATVKAADTQGTTDQSGNVTIALPADKSTVDATISASNFNDAKVTVKVTDQSDKANKFSITPSGKVYFLSKASGKIDVVKTNLDGTERHTVFAGTGSEDDRNTVLLASRDWKYLALLSRRSGSLSKLYLIETATDKVTTMDEGNATFNLVGWHNNYFVYEVDRNNVKYWQARASSLKSFNAATKAIKILDNTAASGSNDYSAQYESFNSSLIHLLGDSIIYTKTWYSGSGYVSSTRKNTLVSINADGTNKKIIRAIGANDHSFGNIVQYESQELLVEESNNNFATNVVYKLKTDGSYTKTNLTDQDLQKAYPTFLLSPSGDEIFWSESRDGKETLFRANKDGSHQKQLASLSPYNTYGWYTDNYLLVSKDSDELYIMSRDGGKPLKISDYHKPDQNFFGYGGGYGGI